MMIIFSQGARGIFKTALGISRRQKTLRHATALSEDDMPQLYQRTILVAKNGAEEAPENFGPSKN